MDEKLPFIPESFDHVVSSYAIYYAEDVCAILEEIKRVLKPAGKVLLIGPTDRNAEELYAFNENMFGFKRDGKVTIRTNRLEKEFYPAMVKAFSRAISEKIDSKLIFPNKDEFLKYYRATLLFEESVKKAGYEPSYTELSSINFPALEISKEIIVIRGEKSEVLEV